MNAAQPRLKMKPALPRRFPSHPETGQIVSEAEMGRIWQEMRQVERMSKKEPTHRTGAFCPKRQARMDEVEAMLQRGPLMSRELADAFGIETTEMTLLLRDLRSQRGTVDGAKNRTLGAFLWRYTGGKS